MYRNIILGLLLSGSISSVVISQDAATPEISDSTVPADPKNARESHLTDSRANEQPVTRSQPVLPGQEKREARTRADHIFSEPVIILIIFGVMAGIVTVILLFAYGIGKLRERSQVQLASPQNTDDPLSSVETGNPE